MQTHATDANCHKHSSKPLFTEYTELGATLVDAFPAPFCTKLIHLAEKPLPLITRNDLKPPRLVPIHEIEEECKFQWTESVKVPEGVKKNYYDTLQKTQYEIDEKSLFTDINSLTLCKMDKLGYGVFANKKILKTKNFMTYTGEKKLQGCSGFYVMNDWNRLHASLKIDESDHASLMGSIDGEKYGNFSRFFQHLFHEPNLKKLDGGLSWIWKYILFPNCATANMCHTITNKEINHCEVRILELIRDVNENEQLGLSYGIEYFIASKINPVIFNKKGEIYITLQIKDVIIKKPTSPDESVSYFWDTMGYSMSALLDIDNWYEKNKETLATIFENPMLPPTLHQYICSRDILIALYEKKSKPCAPEEKEILQKLIEKYTAIKEDLDRKINSQLTQPPKEPEKAKNTSIGKNTSTLFQPSKPCDKPTQHKGLSFCHIL